MTKDEWKEQISSLSLEDLADAERTLRRRVERYQGKVPPRGDLEHADYLWELRECAREAKRRSDAAADKMMTLHEDDSYTLKGEVHGDPMGLQADGDAVAISVGDGVSYFTAIEVPRLVLLLKEMAQRIESN